LLLTALSSGGGGCLACGLALGGHSFKLINVRIPHVLDESIEIAGGVLLVTMSIAVPVILAVVVWCIYKAAYSIAEQDMTNRWLDLATRVVYVATGGWLTGLRKEPAQLCNEALALAAVTSRACNSRFWELLTRDEQTDLAASAVERTFLPDETLCREGQRADHVIVIRSGRTKVCAESPNGQQLIAIRHAGDIIGERAAFRVTERSATMVALGDVTVYEIPTAKFAAFIERHPRILPIIEDQIYERLTENRLQAALIDENVTTGVTRSAGSWSGQNCTIVLVDIADFGARIRSDRDRGSIREALYNILQCTFENANFQRHDYHQEDRGDGVLLVIPPPGRTNSIIDRIHGQLVTLLREYNSTATTATRIQMRVALQVGPVDADAHGVNGRAIIDAARLLDAPVLKQQLAETRADLGFITSTHVYETFIQPSPGHVIPTAGQHLSCQVKKETINAWMYLAQTHNELGSCVVNAGRPG
jgi:CRP-like cAMP-binding protein